MPHHEFARGRVVVHDQDYRPFRFLDDRTDRLRSRVVPAGGQGRFVVLHDPQAGVLACVHAGWRGTVARACAAAVTAMAGLGATPADIVAGIGPAISADRYQVGEEVAEAARDAFGEQAGTVVRPDGTGRFLFDVPAANRLVLRESGLADGNIHATRYVTGGSPGRAGGDGAFFSDRDARPCGRLALVARLSQGDTTR